jgi:hypothetical protein
VHQVREFLAGVARNAGTSDAVHEDMAEPSESWTIPLHVIMWTTIIVGLIMAMAVLMMH